MQEVEDGPALFGCFIALLEVAAKCKNRGVFADGAGHPYDEKRLCILTKMPYPLIKKALEIFSSTDFNWISTEDFAPSENAENADFEDFTPSTLRARSEHAPSEPLCETPSQHNHLDGVTPSKNDENGQNSDFAPSKNDENAISEDFSRFHSEGQYLQDKTRQDKTRQESEEAHTRTHEDQSISRLESRMQMLPKRDLDRFKKFMEAYPKKTDQNGCRRWWAEVKPSVSDVDAMISKIAEGMDSENWLDEDGIPKYAPAPLKWLESAGWNDEYTPRRKKTKIMANGKPEPKSYADSDFDFNQGVVKV